MTDLFPGPDARTWPGPQQLRPTLMAWHLEPTSTTDLVLANMLAFIRLIRRQRESMGLSQRKASELCELNSNAFHFMETGKQGITQYSLADIMHGLGLTRADILAEIRAMEDEEVRDEAA